MATSVQLTRDEIEAALVAGAEASGYLPQQAAIHLLTFTELPGRATFTRHLEFTEVENRNGDRTLGAFVKDWDAFLADRDLMLSGGEARFLALASSLHQGIPISLFEHLTGFGHSYARRVLEAVMIATRVTEQKLYSLTEGPGMERIKALHEQFNVE